MAKKLYTKATVEKDEKGNLLAIASDETVDREGEILSVDGWDLKNYKKNPVLLWSHNPMEPPIGTARNLRITGEGKKRALTFIPSFHELTEMAKSIKTLFNEGILNSFSVGFLPTEQDGNKFTKQELLEISAVAVPANPNARIQARSLIGDDMVNKILDVNKIETKSPACRKKDETKADCVKRKIPELIREDGMKQDQAVAAANSICSKRCESKTIDPTKKYMDELKVMDDRLKNIEKHLAYQARKEIEKGRMSKGDKVQKRLIKAVYSLINELDKR